MESVYEVQSAKCKVRGTKVEPAMGFEPATC